MSEGFQLLRTSSAAAFCVGTPPFTYQRPLTSASSVFAYAMLVRRTAADEFNLLAYEYTMLLLRGNVKTSQWDQRTQFFLRISRLKILEACRITYLPAPAVRIPYTYLAPTFFTAGCVAA